jgi:pyruvate dehydrogenase complex dehydrogenase (E1) component
VTAAVAAREAGATTLLASTRDVAALRALADEGTVERSVVAQAIERYDVDPDAAPPWTV